jgi:phosphoribosyl-ATP pyrophosphohydrolase
MPDLGATLSDLYATLLARRGADPAGSYVASLHAKGLDAILKKVGEEAAETLIAAKNGEREALVHELADLWFHTLVLMAHQDLPPQALADELARRAGTSGHAEKAARGR